MIIDLDKVSKFFDSIEQEIFGQPAIINDIDLEFVHTPNFVEIRDNNSSNGYQLITISKSSINEIRGNISDFDI